MLQPTKNSRSLIHLMMQLVEISFLVVELFQCSLELAIAFEFVEEGCLNAWNVMRKTPLGLYLKLSDLSLFGCGFPKIQQSSCWLLASENSLVTGIETSPLAILRIPGLIEPSVLHKNLMMMMMTTIITLFGWHASCYFQGHNDRIINLML